MPRSLMEIEQQLRELAARLDGSFLNAHIRPDYHGAVRGVGISIVDARGDDVALEHVLRELADDVAQHASPITVTPS